MLTDPDTAAAAVNLVIDAINRGEGLPDPTGSATRWRWPSARDAAGRSAATGSSRWSVRGPWRRSPGTATWRRAGRPGLR